MQEIPQTMGTITKKWIQSLRLVQISPDVQLPEEASQLTYFKTGKVHMKKKIKYEKKINLSDTIADYKLFIFRSWCLVDVSLTLNCLILPFLVLCPLPYSFQPPKNSKRKKTQM